MNRAMLAVGAALLGAAGFGTALGVNMLIASTIAPPEGGLVAATTVSPAPSSEAPAATLATSRGKSERSYSDGILRRNIFDPAYIDTYAPSERTAATGSAKLSDLPVKLLGTMVAEPEIYSSALIAEEGSERGSGYGINQKLLDATIIAIEKKRVKLRRSDGSEEYLTMDDVGAAPREETNSNANDPNGDEDVQKLGDNKFVVSRELVDKYIGDIEGISRLGRALVHRGPDGENDGFRLSAIRRNTLGDKLGIRNGDVVHSVNGQALTSMPAAIGAYESLQSDSSFTFEVTRRGERVTMEYDVR
jgi:type II secretion system protein C